MLLPTEVLILAALGNVFDHKASLYPQENFSPTPKYSSLCIFSLASLPHFLPLYTILDFFPLLPHLLLARDALKLAFQVQTLSNL